MADSCNSELDWKLSARPKATGQNLEKYGELSVSKEKIGQRDSYTIETEYMTILARGDASMIVDKRGTAGGSVKRHIDLPQGIHAQVIAAVEAGLKDCKFDAAANLAQQFYETHLAAPKHQNPRDRR